ncbi:MAG: hypothetical protein OEY14_10320 [Myxococcales bacterium]|nr:hypothetical protein [Myxococcales bacterium]
MSLRTIGMSVFALAIAAMGCVDRDLAPLNPCTVSGVVQVIKVDSVDKVDLLFMVDTSNSMVHEQAALAREIPTLIRALASGELLDPTSGAVIQEFAAVRSLQVGVITSDMNTGGVTVRGCDSPTNGDGILRTQGNTAAGCMATYPSFMEFQPAGALTPDEFATDVACVAVTGTGGCGFEQQLDAVLKALTPSTSTSYSFISETGAATFGHGDTNNSGFVRPGALLALLLVTDEDDCSAQDPQIFSETSTTYTGGLNLRCSQYPGALYPIDRYVNGLLALKPGDPDLLVYAAITGVPTDLVADPESIDYARILSDPRMVETPNPVMPMELAPSCTSDSGNAFPPRRIVSVARDLEIAGAAAVVQSICQASFNGALTSIIKKIADQLGGACLPRALNPDSTGAVECDVVEVLPSAETSDFGTCESLRSLGRYPYACQGEALLDNNGDGFPDCVGVPITLDPDTGREVCRVTQVPVIDRSPGGLPPSSGVGWYYDDYTDEVITNCTDDPQRISFTLTPNAAPKSGTLVRLECLQPVQGSAGEITIGTPCADDSECGAGGSRVDGFQNALFCYTVDNTCRASCASDADCRGGFVCSDSDEDPGTPMICLNPTCS